MSRSFALVTLFLSASLCASSLPASAQDPAPAPAQDPAPTTSPAPAQNSTKRAPKKTKRVWTNENLGDANGTISVVGDPEKPSASKPDTRSTAAAKPTDPRLVASLRQQALGLQAQLDSVDKELADLKNFSRGNSTGSGGLKTNMNYSSASVEDQIRSLTQKKSKIQTALDNVYDAARGKGIEPGQLR